jgi:amino acid transporter
MTPKRTFLQDLGTVVPIALVWCGVVLYLGGPYAKDWTTYVVVVGVTVFFLRPLVYYRYRKDKTLTRDGYLKRAIVSGCLVVVYMVLGLVGLRVGRPSIANWSLAAAWIVVTFIYLRSASKAERTRYVPHV